MSLKEYRRPSLRDKIEVRNEELAAQVEKLKKEEKERKVVSAPKKK